MKNLCLLLLVLPFQLFAQKADLVDSDSVNVANKKLNTWYKNTYKMSSSESRMVSNSEAKPVSKNLYSYMHSKDMFLFTPNVYTNRPFSANTNLTNAPYFNGYLDRTGGATVGQLLVAGGINYLLDKAITGKEKKSKK